MGYRATYVNATPLRLRRIAAGFATVACLACSGGERTVVEPPPPTTAVLTLTIQPDPEDVSVAQQLGWASGIPSAEVKLTPTDSTLGTAQSFTSNSAGIVSVPDAKAGAYLVEVQRLFTTADVAKLGQSPSATGFVGRATINSSGGTVAFTVAVPASKRRSLIFNEISWRAGSPGPGECCFYDNGFLEVYNNSDTTIYLDGITVGESYDVFYEYSAIPCSVSYPFLTDPLGVWALWHYMFPGNGRDNPLKPGGLVTIAQDAIDHRELYPTVQGLPDLRGADFEFIGPADVDNPSVPNMVDRSYDSIEPHGLPHISSGGTFFLALPLSLDSLPRMTDPRSGNTRRWWRFPASSILDFFMAIYDGSFGYKFCSPLAAPNFDREPGAFFHDDDLTDFRYSASRKRIGTTADGRAILQHTHSSAADFTKGPISPGKM
jgi:hypothetical protein